MKKLSEYKIFSIFKNNVKEIKMQTKQLRESTDKISPEWADFTPQHADADKFTDTIKSMISERPKEAKQHHKYIDIETGELWTMHNRCWVNKGNPIPTLRHKIEVDAKKAEKKIKAAKKASNQKKVDDLIIESLPNPKQENLPGENPPEIDNSILDKIKESSDSITLPAPDPDLIVGNRFYFIVDLTPNESGYKFLFEFVNFICRSFTGSTIYLIGDSSNYTHDHFMRKQPNVMKLPKCDKKTYLSYIAYARRYYTFIEDYIEYGLEHNINGITLFLPTSEKGNDTVKGVDYCYMDKDVDISIIPANKGNVLKY